MFKNMKIRKKLILAFILVTVISSMGSIIGIVNMRASKPAGNIPAETTAQTTASSGTAQDDMTQHSPEMQMLSIMGVSYVVAIAAAVLISRTISKPIVEMTEASQKIAQGDLNVQIKSASKDEVGQLGAALTESNASIKAYISDISRNLGKMAQGDLNIDRSLEYRGDFAVLSDSIQDIADSLNETLTSIYQAAEQVSSGSNQVSGSAQALAQGATEQASSIEQLSASIEEISENVKQNAEFAASASVNVGEVSSELEISNEHMQEMLTAMTKINTSSSEIGKIIKTIEDIAFQTNILALNAAVEAARAGAAGKGFAVVADEVRNLASKSADAAKNTTLMIQNSITEVENGTQIADKTAVALRKVVEDTRSVAETMKHISQNSNLQASSINEITLGIEQVSGVVQANSATSEESAAASEELSGQAETMKELVGRFQLANCGSERA